MSYTFLGRLCGLFAISAPEIVPPMSIIKVNFAVFLHINTFVLNSEIVIVIFTSL